MDIDEIIIKTFGENQNICFPIHCQREAKCFIKTLFKNGINGIIFSQEIGESETNFTSWKNGLSKLGIGKKVMKRINKPIEDFLWSDDELNDLKRELKTEVDKIKSMKSRKTNINRKIELGRSPTSKSVSEKLFKKEKRIKIPKKVKRNDSGDSRVLKSIISPINNFDGENKHPFARNLQRGISCPGPEKESHEMVEDFKAIRLRKTGRKDLLDGDVSVNDNSNTDSDEIISSANEERGLDGTAISRKDDSKDNGAIGGVNVALSWNPNESDKFQTTEKKDPEITKSDLNATKHEQTLPAIAPQNNSEAEKETNETCREEDGAIAADDPVDYLYVFSDSNSCNSSPIKSHRFKIGVASCPYEELKKASEFNVDIKLISATAVKNPQQVMERVQEELQVFLMKGRENWYYCPLTKVSDSRK